MLDDLLSVIFPEHCRGCNRSGAALCRDCCQSIPCAADIVEPRHAFALFDYRHPLVRQAIWELKYHRKSPLTRALIRSGSKTIAHHIASQTKNLHLQTIVLVPIPQYYSKTHQRGFNQSNIIGKWVAAALPTATLQPLLKKTRRTIAQAQTLNKQQRRENLIGSMTATTPLHADILYVLLDDVITTGSTITEAGRALRAAGATHVCAIAIAHG